MEALQGSFKSRVKKPRGFWFCAKLFSIMMGVLFSQVSLAKSADNYIEEARGHRAARDLPAAAVTYQKALKLDQHNAIARRELRDILIESKRQDPEGEYSEAEWALLEDQNRVAQEEIAEASEAAGEDEIQ